MSSILEPPSEKSGQKALQFTQRVGKYYVGRILGEGTYAKVKYGQHIDTGETVAIKILDKEQLMRSGMVEQIKREINILKQIKHPHVVELKEVLSSKGKIFMVMELITGGELFDKLAAEGPMKESQARVLFTQLLDALNYCHIHGVYHRDLKPENVLLTSTLQVKLSDFGLGSLRESDTTQGLLNTTCGTPNYVAPEVLAKVGYDGGKADIWSLGVVLYVMLAGCLPFDEDDLVALFHVIEAAAYEVPPWLSSEAVAMLSAMLQPDPEKRASIGQLWLMPWMMGVNRPGSNLPRVSSAVSMEDDIFKENSALKGESSRSLNPNGSIGSKKLNAFELISRSLNIEALVETKEELITRRTKFSSNAPPTTILRSIEHAAVAVGGRVELRPGNRMKLWIPRPKGRLQVNVEVFQILANTFVADLSKVQGNTAEFYRWYDQLTDAIQSIISKKHTTHQILSRMSVGDARHRMNAFEFINSNFSLVGLFESNEERATRHVQFATPCSPQEVFAALEAGAKGSGGTLKRTGDKRALLVVPSGHSRYLELTIRMFRLTKSVNVVQMSRDVGSSMDLFRFYNHLAAQYLSNIIARRDDGRQVHPKAMRAQSLLSTQALSQLDKDSSSSRDSPRRGPMDLDSIREVEH